MTTLPAAPGAETPQAPPITVSLDPDPRGVSVGVWQGSRCIYTGAHAVPAPAAGDARDAARYRVVRMVAADKENGYALMAEASREVGIEVGRYPTPEQFDAVVDLLAAQQGEGGGA